MNATDEKYWAEYDGLQHAKHQLLRKYLGGWFPILSSWSGRVLYLDCHAGRGRHRTGHEGSPILALRLLLEHRQRQRILALTEVRFIFFEIDQTNYNLLLKEINTLGQLPRGVWVDNYHDDYEDVLRRTVDNLGSQSERLAPAFAFVDPYGFKLSMDLLNDLLGFPQCELLINFMYRYVDMAIHNPAQAANMDSLFGCRHWRELIGIEDNEERAEKIIALFSSQLRADFVTHMYMRAKNGVLKYVLLHATNHRRGREVMKGAMWAVTPDGSFTAFERHAPAQLVLIVPDPDLEPLREHLWTCFAGKQVRMKEIYDWLVGELYLKSHLHTILRDYRNRKIVDFSDYGDRFAFNRDPLASFPSERQEGS
jgi:three-Cys-motif partner protein